VNKSADVLKSSARNLSSFLKKEVINPWSVSSDSVQVIKEENVIFEYAGQKKYNSANLLGVVVLSVLFGIILSGLGDNGKPIVDLFSCLFKVVMKIVAIVIWYVYRAISLFNLINNSKPCTFNDSQAEIII
jgi:Na+/H+-dicarboxylate symporter